MNYNKTITLKDGRACTLRNGTERDGQALLDIYLLTHAQTDYLLSYPDETSFTAEQEAEYLKRKTDSANEIEILAELEGTVVGGQSSPRRGSAASGRKRRPVTGHPSASALTRHIGASASGGS